MVIATLIAAGGLEEERLRAAERRLADAGLTVARRDWIDVGSSIDVEIAGEDRAQVRSALEGSIPGMDVVVQSPGSRRRKLLVADMDSTMIEQECIDELADFAGVGDRVAEITDRAMRGELDFAAALTERIRLVEGLEESAIDRCLAERIRVRPGAATLVRTMRAFGARTVLVTGGFTAFAEPVADEIGFEVVHANRLRADRGRIIGLGTGPIVDSQAKRAALLAHCAELGIDPADSLAVGDGANDAPMIVAAGLGVAFHAKPVLAAQADARIDHHGLEALLWAQGIPRREWVTA